MLVINSVLEAFSHIGHVDPWETVLHSNLQYEIVNHRNLPVAQSPIYLTFEELRDINDDRKDDHRDDVEAERTETASEILLQIINK